MTRQWTPNGARFLALTLYFQQVADRRRQRLHIWRVLKAWERGALQDIQIKITSSQEE